SARFDPVSGMTPVCMPFCGTATLADVLDQAFPTPGASPPPTAEFLLRVCRSTARPGDPPPEPPPGPVRPPRGTYADGILLWAAQVADALAYLHGQGVVHGDLKPSNVLLSPDGRALLIDFNLAYNRRTGQGNPGGTLPYMAP